MIIRTKTKEAPKRVPFKVEQEPITLRPYQEEAHGDILDFLLSDESRVALISPTGSGKTTTVLSILARLRKFAEAGEGKITGALVIAPQRQIVDGFRDERDIICGKNEPGSVPEVLSEKCFVDLFPTNNLKVFGTTSKQTAEFRLRWLLIMLRLRA